MWQSGAFCWSQVAKSINQQRDTNEALTVYDIQVKGIIVPFATWAGQAKFIVAPSLPYGVFLGKHWWVCTKDSDLDGKGPGKHEKYEDYVMKVGMFKLEKWLRRYLKAVLKARKGYTMQEGLRVFCGALDCTTGPSSVCWEANFSSELCKGHLVS